MLERGKLLNSNDDVLSKLVAVIHLDDDFRLECV
jgi:hypothetical protein